MPYLMIKVLNHTLTNDVISFEQFGPDDYDFVTYVTHLFNAYHAGQKFEQKTN